MPDIYFTEKYGRLYEGIEKGRLEIFDYKSEQGEVRNMFIIREIPIKTDQEIYYDIITPYGYGGPRILSCPDESEKEALVRGYYEVFKDYCREQRIVSEFIRFHPILENYKDFTKIYDVKFNRKTVGTKLNAKEDPFSYDFKKECRRQVRKALRNGAEFEIIEKPDNLEDFKGLYYQTMERNNALDYYYFDDAYFDAILRDFKNEFILVNVFLEGKTIASKLCFISENLIHCHLSGSLENYFDYSPGYILEYATALWGRENHYDYIHHGGGRTNAPDDKLLQFKKNFGRHTEFDFFRGEKIWDQKVYRTLCQLKGVCEEKEFFPNYRVDPRQKNKDILI